MAEFKVTMLCPKQAYIEVPDEDLEDMTKDEIIEHVVFQAQEMNSFDQVEDYGEEEYKVERLSASGKLTPLGKL